MEYDEKLLNLNIFNRCIFGKSSIDEMSTILEYYTECEDFERCLVIKELMDIDYCTIDPILDDINIITEIIKNNKHDLKEITDIGHDIIEKSNNGETLDDSEILDDIDSLSDDILVNIMESSKLKNEYLKKTYDNIINLELPNVKKERTTNLLIEYRKSSIENLKKFIDIG